jgi:hypothetical protein
MKSQGNKGEIIFPSKKEMMQRNQEIGDRSVKKNGEIGDTGMYKTF